MSFVRYKKFGNKEYAYEVTSYWDKKTKKPRQKTKYLGVVIDKEKMVFGNPLKERIRREEFILDFGDTFLLTKFLEKEGFTKLLKESFGEKADMLVNLISYKLCHPSALRLAETWQNGNAIKHLCKANLASQRISELLTEVGDEEAYRNFFTKYLSQINHSSDGLLLDITALPNQIHTPFTQWGYHDEDIDKQIKLMLVVDKKNQLPLFFRYIPGSIPDVSTLKPTIEELKKYGIKDTYSILDAGFYSEGNIRAVQKEEMPFMIRLPSNRVLYKELVEESRDLERLKHAIVYGERGLFVKKHRIHLFGEKAYAYVVLDPMRKGRETRKLILGLGEKDDVVEDREFMLRKKGVMILVSSIDVPEDDVVPSYYSRQTAEQLFKFAKDDLKLLPLRSHKEESMQGYLLLVFMALIVFLLVRKKSGKRNTVEEVLLSLRNLKAKVYGGEMIISEMNKKQRLLFEGFDIIVPKVLGI